MQLDTCLDVANCNSCVYRKDVKMFCNSFKLINTRAFNMRLTFPKNLFI